MKKIYILMLLLSATMIASAQKITITTSEGQKVEIACDKAMPSEIQIEGNRVILKMDSVRSQTQDTTLFEESDSIDTFVPVDSVETRDSLYSGSSLASSFANSLAEEFFPEYAAFNKEHANDHPSKEELVRRIVKNIEGEDAANTVDFLSAMFKNFRLTSDSSFVAQYEQRKPKRSWRTYDIVSLDGSLGKNFNTVTEGEELINKEDYGDDTQNEKKWGGGLNYSRVYMLGKENENGQWEPNNVGFALSWGGLIAYSHEKDMGSNFSLMGKAGVQIGRDLTIGIDALVGGGITPYNTFLTNAINHSLVKRSVLCFKYGIQAWGSLNFSADTYTALYARFIASTPPSSSNVILPQGWGIVLENFDPTSWTIGLAVGYKFGAPNELSRDKRLQASFSTGYSLIGNKGFIYATEIERLTKVSNSTTLSYGLTVEELFGKKDEDKERCSSIMFSAGFKVCQPDARWFWGTKLYAGVGNFVIDFSGSRSGTQISDTVKKLCGRGALQLGAGYNLGKYSEISAAVRGGYHFAKSIETEGFDEVSYENLRGLDLSVHLGYKYTF